MPPRLTAIGDLERPDHYYITPQHRCYFWGEYTPYEHTDGKLWRFSPTNQLIANLKKGMDKRGQLGWHYKGEAIDGAARAFAESWKWKELQKSHQPALIPIPPSKARTDPLYDPRMLEVANGIARHAGVALDIRDCLSFDGTCSASHATAARPSPDDLYRSLSFDQRQGSTAPGVIFLLDDMLTTGAHYVAAVRRLGEVFPGVTVIGNFVARRRLPSAADDFSVIDV